MARDHGEWLLAPERGRDGIDALIGGLAERLVADGIELVRCSCSFRTANADVWVRNVTWKRGSGAVVRPRTYDELATAEYRGSAVEAIHAGKASIRVRLDVPPEAIPYPQIRELRLEGATEYVIHALPLSSGLPTFVSYATARRGGFLDSEIAMLEGLLPALRLRVELASAYLATESLLHVYLGANAASRVLSGSFRRGTGEEIDAVVWTCDLRGFTALSDERPAHEVVERLDVYFDCVAGTVESHGGEVLKFVGDAVMAIFPVEAAGEATACARGVHAGEESLDALAAWSARTGGVPFSIGIGIHRGVVTYGNVGARDRLDFTVIGRAVNEASRVESLCKELGVPLLLTDTVAPASGRSDLVSLGKHSLRGVKTPHELFTLRRFRS